MTKQELAQKIKAKYPQYQSIEDNELADKIIAKYPVYQSQITETKPSLSSLKENLSQRGEQFKETFEKTASGEINPLQTGIRTVGTAIGGVGDVLFQVIKEGVKAISPKTVESIKSGVAKVGESDLVQNVAAKYSDWATRNPEQAKDLEATLNIASIIPVGKAAQVGSKAVGQVAKQTGTALKSAATKVKPAIGSALSTTGAIGEKAGKSVVSASLSPTMEQAGRIITYKSKTPLLTRLQQASKGIEKAPITPADVAIKYDLASLSRSQIGIKAKRVANDLFENQVKPALSSIKEKVSKQELFNSVKKEIEKIKDISTRKAQLNALESLADDYKNVSSWSYKTLDTIKSEMAKRLPSKVWKGQDIAGDLNNVRKILSDKARNVIRKKLPKEITTIYDEYGSLKELSERGAKALTSGLNTNLIGLTGEAMRIATTPITTLGGSAISKAGTAVRKLGNKLLKSKPLPKAKGEILKSSSKATPKTVKVWVKSKFSDSGGYTEFPVIRKVENKTLYQGSKPGESRQFWTPNKKYAEQFGDVKEKTGSFYQVDNGNRMTDVYIEVPKILKSKPLKTTNPLIQEAKKYKSAEEFVKAQSLYHGTPNELEGGVLKFGAGKQLKKGGYMGGHFLTDTPEIAENFSFGGKVYQASGEIKNKVLDVNKNKKLFQDYIGKEYLSDGEKVKFTKQDFDYMFPNGKADWSTINIDLLEQLAKKQGKIGVSIPEYAGGKQGMTYQIFEDNIPVYTKSQLIDIWNKANSGGYFYHGTNEYILDNITKEGLKPGRRGQLSLSKTEEYSKFFAKDGMTPKGKTSGIILRVKEGALEGKTMLKRTDGKPRPKSDQINEILTKETIPPSMLEIKQGNKWIPLSEWNKAQEAQIPTKPSIEPSFSRHYDSSSG